MSGATYHPIQTLDKDTDTEEQISSFDKELGFQHQAVDERCFRCERYTNSRRRSHVWLAILPLLFIIVALCWALFDARSTYCSASTWSSARSNRQRPSPHPSSSPLEANLSGSSSPSNYEPSNATFAGKPLNACYCGKNTAEAISLGCIFDMISPSWLPPHCHDAHLEAKFLSAASTYYPDSRWHYYTSPNRTSEYTIDQVRHFADYWEHGEGIAGATISWEWHMLHCLYLYEKAMRARQGWVVLEQKYETVGHAEHCTMMFLMPRDTFTVVALDGEVHGGEEGEEDQHEAEDEDKR
ncbi:hypothetical protein Slin14017_G098560 [Septoria linicola]|nr:hypothetical protein Slin14017_G098560 [Septoria linicola]